MEYQLATASPSVLARHALEDDRLVIVHEPSARRDEVRFSEIRAIQLRHSLGAYVMQISRASGSAITIRSRCVLTGGIEDRVAEYVELATRLHDATREHHPAIRFVGGSTGLYWLGWLLLALGALLTAIVGWALVTGAEAPPRGLFAVIPLALVAGGALVHQGRATPYDPSAPPPKLLPR